MSLSLDCESASASRGGELIRSAFRGWTVISQDTKKVDSIFRVCLGNERVVERCRANHGVVFDLRRLILKIYTSIGIYFVEFTLDKFLSTINPPPPPHWISPPTNPPGPSETPPPPHLVT